MPEPEASSPVPVRTERLLPPFTELRWFAELDSTNRYALEAARRGAPSGLVVAADHQTAGRGRLGRAWVAPPGASLLVSVLLRPAEPRERRSAFVATAGVAMAEVIEAHTGVVASLKWPNDLLVEGRKLAGVLAESAGEALVVGLGVNVAWTDVPDELARIATACNLEGGRPVARPVLLEAFLERYALRLTDPDAARAAYEARLATIGRRVRIEQLDRTLVGTARGIDAAGRLVLSRDDGDEVRVSVGDVVHLRDAE